MHEYLFELIMFKIVFHLLMLCNYNVNILNTIWPVHALMSYEGTLNLCLVPNDDIDQNVQFDDFSFVYIIYIRMFSTIYFGTLLFNISNANIDPLNLIAINMNDSMFRNIRFIIIIWHINWLSKFIFSLYIYWMWMLTFIPLSSNTKI